MRLSSRYIDSSSHTERLFGRRGILRVRYGEASATDEVCGEAAVGVRRIVGVGSVCPGEDVGETPVSHLFLVLGAGGGHFGLFNYMMVEF